MTLRRLTTERTHAEDGSLTMSEIIRRERAVVDASPMVTRCSIWGCDWTHEGTAADGRAAFVEHRKTEHPTAHRIAQSEERRRAQKSSSGGGDHAEPVAAEDSGREPSAKPSDPTPQTDPGGALPRLESSPRPGFLSPEAGSRPDAPSVGDVFGRILRLYADTLDDVGRTSDQQERLSDVSSGLRALGDWMTGRRA